METEQGGVLACGSNEPLVVSGPSKAATASASPRELRQDASAAARDEPCARYGSIGVHVVDITDGYDSAAEKTPADAQAATARVKTLLSVSSGIGGSCTKTAKSYNVASDRKKDTIKTSATAMSGGNAFGSMCVTVNGRILKTVKNSYGMQEKEKLITLSNGMRFLYVSFTGSNNDGGQRILQCSKGKFKTICSNKTIKAASHSYLDRVKVGGNSVIVTFEPTTCDLGAGFEVDYTYKYKSSTLKRTSSTSTSLRYYYGSRKCGKGWLANAASMKIYATKSCKTKKFTAKKNMKMKVTAVYVKSGKIYYKVKTASGKTGWFKGLFRYSANSHLFNRSTLFNQTLMAG